MAINKESVLVVTGTVRGASQPVPHSYVRVLAPGGNFALSLRAAASCQIWLDAITYRVAADAKAEPGATSGDRPAGNASSTESPLASNEGKSAVRRSQGPLGRSQGPLGRSHGHVRRCPERARRCVRAAAPEDRGEQRASRAAAGCAVAEHRRR